ncbi:MAG: hypothetical protein RL033_3515 [Pseudomonadota bacterium]|jgi:hypothetical protein
MNFVDDRTLPLCITCSSPLYPELELQDATGLACDTCFAKSEAAMATARQAEAADEFRWQSHEWFRLSYLERQPFMTRNQFGDLR